LAPQNTFEKAIYNASTDTFTLVGDGMLSLNGGESGTVNKALFDWSKFDINLGGTGVFNSITANDILSVTVDSDSRLSIRLTATKANTLETHTEWSVTTPATNSQITDVLSIEAGFTLDAAGRASVTDGNDTLRFNTINLGTHQGGSGSDTWANQNAGWLINPVLVDDNKLFYAWDRNAGGTHDGGDVASFSGTNGLAAFMGKGASSNVTEDVNSRSFTLNGVDLRLPTDGNPASVNHVDPANLVGGQNFADGRDIYVPGNPVNAPQTRHTGWYVPQGTSVSGTGVNASYDDVLAIWDAFNGTGQNNSVWSGTAWVSQVNGTPTGWAQNSYWSATPAGGSGHVRITLTHGNFHDDTDGTSRYVAFEVL
jgi:hypothetical protein